MITVIVKKNDCRRHCMQVVASFCWPDDLEPNQEKKKRATYFSIENGCGVITRPGGNFKEKLKPNTIINVRRFMLGR